MAAQNRREFLSALSVLGLGACAPVRTVAVPANVPRSGAQKPEVVLQEIGDYQCSFCAAVQPAVKRVMGVYGDRVALVWRNYPLARHERAMEAAEAALEARAQLGDPGFWQYHDVLFRNQHALAREDLKRYAQAFAIDPTRFARALELGIHKERVLSDKSEIAAMKLPGFGTPAFIIGADVFVGSYTFEELSELLEDAL